MIERWDVDAESDASDAGAGMDVAERDLDNWPKAASAVLIEYSRPSNSLSVGDLCRGAYCAFLRIVGVFGGCTVCIGVAATAAGVTVRKY